jgi:hypothetical protein
MQVTFQVYVKVYMDGNLCLILQKYYVKKDPKTALPCNEPGIPGLETQDIKYCICISFLLR